MPDTDPFEFDAIAAAKGAKKELPVQAANARADQAHAEIEAAVGSARADS